MGQQQAVENVSLLAEYYGQLLSQRSLVYCIVSKNT